MRKIGKIANFQPFMPSSDDAWQIPKKQKITHFALHMPSVLCYKARHVRGSAPLVIFYDPFSNSGKRRPTVQVTVRDNNVDQALKALKKKMQREGIFREMKLRRSYEKPSERRAREKAEAIRRGRKLERKRIEREGF
jgi:small subunit ribosomal protein S21